jgi:hypothetical protein
MAMENKISENVRRNLMNCHLSIFDIYVNYGQKMILTQEHKLFMTTSYFRSGNEENSDCFYHTEPCL